MGTLITMKTMATTEMTTAVTNQLFGIKSEMRIVDAFDLLDDGMATLWKEDDNNLHSLPTFSIIFAMHFVAFTRLSI